MPALHRITFAPLLVLLLAPSVLHAQSPGDRVRVIRPADQSVVLVGRFERASPDSVWLVPAGRAEPVAAPLGGGMRLERSLGRRGHALTGLLIGAGVGAAAGIVFWAGFCGENSDNFCDGDEELRIAAIFIIPPAALGAGIGALIRTERWAPVMTVRPAPGGGAAFGLGVTLRL